MATLTSKGSLKIGYKGSLFQKPKCEYELNHVLPEGETPTETKLLVEAFKKLFTKGFAKLAAAREKAIKSAMEATEKDWKKKPPKDMDAAVKVANQMIQQGVDVWRNVEVPKLAEECIENVYAYMEKKLKKKLNRKKAKVVLKIVVLVLIVVAAAAISIATAGLAAPLAAGITAGVVIGMIATGVTALVKSGQIVYKEYNAYQGFLDKIKKDVDAIEKAIDYEIKKKKAAEYRKLGPKEKVKLLMGGTKAHVKSLNKHLDAAEARFILMRKENLKAIAAAAEAKEHWDKMSSHPNKAVSAEALKAKEMAGRTARTAEKFDEKLKAFAKLKTEVKAQLLRLDKTGEFSSDKVTGVLKFAGDHQEFAQSVVTGGKTLFDLTKKLNGVLKKLG
ncbi:hypothetical protein [Neptunicoccus sediminis]|uniref:hypothetical protein n=1 Tax=Neptunicoccus sediminis TaxID=1892596 RepID=UPI00084624B5|nr:hypothetical protein [Neptunicoccus sediminis]